MSRPDKPYQFYSTCVCLYQDGEAIREMVDRALPVTYRTWLKHCDETQELERTLGYDRDLRLKNDWHVSFARSKFKGARCYYLRWSAIEHIFIHRDDLHLLGS